MCPGFWKSHFYLLDRCKLNETIIDNEKIWHSQFYFLVIWFKTIESQIKYSHKIRNPWYLTWYMACNPRATIRIQNRQQKTKRRKTTLTQSTYSLSFIWLVTINNMDWRINCQGPPQFWGPQKIAGSLKRLENSNIQVLKPVRRESRPGCSHTQKTAVS